MFVIPLLVMLVMTSILGAPAINANHPGVVLSGTLVPDVVSGFVVNANMTDIGLDGMALNITGNQSGFLWAGVTYYNGVMDRHGFYTTGVVLNWKDNESITVRIVNESQSGFVGNSTGIACPCDYLDLNVYAIDIQKPIYSNLSFSPPEVYTNTNVNFSIVWTDNSAASWMSFTGIAAPYIWHNTSGVWTNYTCNSNASLFSYLLPSSMLNKGANVGWYLSACDYAGNCNTTLVQNFTVGNRLPVVNSINMLPDPAYMNSTLDCVTDTTDADDDIVVVEYRWWRNSTLIQNQTAQTLSSGNFNINDTITCEATPYDGYQRGSPVNSTRKISPWGVEEVNTVLSQGWNLMAIPVEV